MGSMDFKQKWEAAEAEVVRLREHLQEALALAREALALVDYDPGDFLGKRLAEMMAEQGPFLQRTDPNIAKCPHGMPLSPSDLGTTARACIECEYSGGHTDA